MTRTHLLDFKRAFSRRWAVGVLPRLFEFVFQPIFVALVVCLAFLAKEKESSIPAFSNAFFYFTGLYAFWVGLFGSCQSLNGEVQNGEWSYWTLGLRRYIPGHVLSVFGVNLVCALWNMALFIVSVVVVSCFLPSCRGFNPFVSCFLTLDSLAADPFWQCGYMLKPLLVAKYGACGPLLFATGVYSLSLFAATICGVCFGMLLSLLPDPAISLNASVAFVVLLGMISLLGLQGDKGRSGKPPPSLTSEFANRFESRHFSNCKTENRAVRALIWGSRFLPQRYFFNMARMPLEKNNDESMIQSICKGLDLSGNSESAWWNCTEQLTSPSANWALKRWGIPASTGDPPPDASAYLAAHIKSDPDFERRNQIKRYWKTFWKAQWLELVPLGWMCLICLLAVNVGVLTLPQYRRLR